MTDQYHSTNINAPRRTVTVAATTALDVDADLVVVNTTGLGAPPTITLPDARVVDGRAISIKVPVATAGSGGQNVVVDTVGGQTIDGAASVTIAIDQTALTVKSDNANWRIVCLTDANAGGEIIFGDLFLDSASPTLTIGNGTGSPTLVLNKSDAGIATFDMNVAGITRWDWLFDAAENLSLERRDATGVLVDVPILFDITAGNVAVANVLLVAGAVAANSAAGATNLVVGTITSALSGITIESDPTGTGRLAFHDITGGTMRGGLIYAHTSGTLTFQREATAIARITATGFDPQTTGVQSLGTSALRWNEGFINQLLVAGALAANAPAGATNLIIGDGTAAAGLTIFTTTTTEGSIVFNDVSGAENASFVYDHNAARFEWVVETSTELLLSTSTMTPGANAGLALGISTLRFGPSFFNQISYDAQVAADGATIALGSSKLVQATAPTALTTLTLPTAVEGDDYFIDAVNITAGIAITAAAGDAINGGVVAGTATLSTLGLYHIYAVDDTNWRLHGPIALGPLSA